MYVWTRWLTKLAETAPVGGLLYLGSDHPDLLATPGPDRAEHLLLASGNPALKDDYAEAAERSDRLRFTPVVVGNGPRTFHVMTLPGLSGLAAPAEVLELFPGLREVETCEVAAQSLAALLEGLPQSAGKLRVLRAELPGSEAEILDALLALPEDAAPDHVFLRVPAAGLYAVPRALPDLAAALEESVFSLEDRSDEDPDFIEYWIRPDPLKRENRALREALAKAETRAEQAAAQGAAHAEQRAALETRQTEAEAQLGKQERELAELRKALAAARTQVEEATRRGSGLESQLGEAEKQRAALETRRTEAEAQLGKQEQELAELRKALAAARTQVEEATRRGSGLESQLGEAEKQRAALETRQAEAEGTLDKQGRELAELRDGLAAARKQVEESGTRIAELETRLREAEEQRAALETREAETGKKAAEAAGQVTRLEGQLRDRQEQLRKEESRRDALRLEAEAAQNTVLRQQTMARSDYLDLSRRYQDLQAERRAQEQLLQEVVTRLRDILSKPAAGRTKPARKKPGKAKTDG
ncbi:hypothetical protein KUW09_24140 [Mameliella alba]|nr:hypothetical protein [Antarctobacter heliothermus]MBY6147165.1 hypothetical protein [Mameliella alba]MCA0957198.1 hypothetical protein [Mameliella alba]